MKTNHWDILRSDLVADGKSSRVYFAKWKLPSFRLTSVPSPSCVDKHMVKIRRWKDIHGACLLSLIGGFCWNCGFNGSLSTLCAASTGNGRNHTIYVCVCMFLYLGYHPACKLCHTQMGVQIRSCLFPGTSALVSGDVRQRNLAICFCFSYKQASWCLIQKRDCWKQPCMSPL